MDTGRQEQLLTLNKGSPMTTTQEQHFIKPGKNNLNHLNPFHQNTRSHPRKNTLWDYIEKTNSLRHPNIDNFIHNSQKNQQHFNPYGKKLYKAPPSSTINHPTQTKINLPHQQREGINILPESDSLKIGFLNINGLYPNKEDRMLELIQYMTQHQIDIFGLSLIHI